MRVDKQQAVRIAWDGAQFLTVWEDKRNVVKFFDERTDVYAARISEAGAVLDPNGFVVTADPRPEMRPSVASGGGQTLIAASLFRSGTPYAAYRLGIFRTTGTATNPPVAAFSASPVTGCAPVSAVFVNQTTGTVTSWAWSFGDGGTSTDVNPTHVNTTPGTYTVSLLATGPDGSDTEVKADYITAGPPVIAAFSASSTAGRFPLTVTFTDQSTGRPESWFWSFGDGATSAAENPSHEYTASGTYTLALTVTSPCGANTLTRTGDIAVGGPCPIVSVATGETSGYGTVFNDYTATQTSGGLAESLTEVLSGGNPSKRYSRLEHRWHLERPAGGSATFHVTAYRIANPEGDLFTFEYSADGTTFTTLGTSSLSGYNSYSAPLPPGPAGPVIIRVVDTDHTQGNQVLDAITVDYLDVVTTIEGPPPPMTSMHVGALTVKRIQLKGNRVQARTSVLIVDENGAPVSGATVSGHFTGGTDEIATGVSGPGGMAILASSAVKGNPATWCMTVDDVSAPDHPYDPGANVLSSACEIAAAASDPMLVHLGDRTGGGFGVRFSLRATARVQVRLFDVQGRMRLRIADGEMTAGVHDISADTAGLPSGLHFYRIEAGGESVTRKITLGR